MSKTAFGRTRRRNSSRSTALAWAVVLFALAILGACFGSRNAAVPASSAPAPSSQASNWSGSVTHVSDGDTLWVAPQSGGPPRKIRLDGIDAPESCQRFGPAARDALRERVLHRRVEVATRRLDEYRRELARVTIDGQDLGAWMVAQGNAWSYRYRRDPGPYAAEEQAARRARRGLFADPAAQVPREFRKTHGPCE